MFELLTQLRALLPYLNRLIPLIEKGVLKGAPDLSDLRKEVAQIYSASRQTVERADHQDVRLLKIEEQVSRARESADQAQKRLGELLDALRVQKRWLRFQAVLSLILLGLLIAVLCLILR